MIPIFLDCEASSLNHDSYPIEIAWNDEQGNIESYLINPYGYPKSYTDWEPDSQAIHGLSRKYLSQTGKHPDVVANHLNNKLEKKTVYTDAPDFDAMWCDRLFSAVGIDRAFEVKNIYELLEDILPMEYWAISDGLNMVALKQRARKECGLNAHRAKNDVAYLIELYRISCEFSR